jgi:hypothetical protein
LASPSTHAVSAAGLLPSHAPSHGVATLVSPCSLLDLDARFASAPEPVLSASGQAGEAMDDLGFVHRRDRNRPRFKPIGPGHHLWIWLRPHQL